MYIPSPYSGTDKTVALTTHVAFPPNPKTQIRGIMNHDEKRELASLQNFVRGRSSCCSVASEQSFCGLSWSVQTPNQTIHGNTNTTSNVDPSSFYSSVPPTHKRVFDWRTGTTTTTTTTTRRRMDSRVDLPGNRIVVHKKPQQQQQQLPRVFHKLTTAAPLGTTR